jgi:hypothetical protein
VTNEFIRISGFLFSLCTTRNFRNAPLYTKTHDCAMLRDINIKVIGRNVPRNNSSRCLFYIYFAAICFGPRWPSSGRMHNYFREVTSLQRIRCFVLLILFCIWFGKCCRRLSNMWKCLNLIMLSKVKLSRNRPWRPIGL